MIDMLVYIGVLCYLGVTGVLISEELMLVPADSVGEDIRVTGSTGSRSINQLHI